MWQLKTGYYLQMHGFEFAHVIDEDEDKNENKDKDR